MHSTALSPGMISSLCAHSAQALYEAGSRGASLAGGRQVIDLVSTLAYQAVSTSGASVAGHVVGGAVLGGFWLQFIDEAHAFQSPIALPRSSPGYAGAPNAAWVEDTYRHLVLKVTRVCPRARRPLTRPHHWWPLVFPWPR